MVPPCRRRTRRAIRLVVGGRRAAAQASINRASGATPEENRPRMNELTCVLDSESERGLRSSCGRPRWPLVVVDHGGRGPGGPARRGRTHLTVRTRQHEHHDGVASRAARPGEPRCALGRRTRQRARRRRRWNTWHLCDHDKAIRPTPHRKRPQNVRARAPAQLSASAGPWRSCWRRWPPPQAT